MFDAEDDLWFNALTCSTPSSMTEEEMFGRLED